MFETAALIVFAIVAYFAIATLYSLFLTPWVQIKAVERMTADLFDLDDHFEEAVRDPNPFN